MLYYRGHTSRIIINVQFSLRPQTASRLVSEAYEKFSFLLNFFLSTVVQNQLFESLTTYIVTHKVEWTILIFENIVCIVASAHEL